MVFDKQKNGEPWQPLPAAGANAQRLEGWDVELRHGREGWTKSTRMQTLLDLRDTEFTSFMGTAVYRKRFDADELRGTVLNLGEVAGVSDVRLNGKELGVQWYGRRLYDLSGALEPGENELEVRVTTTMGNYMKTLTGNKIAQKWTNRKSKEQPQQSMGLLGPVTGHNPACGPGTGRPRKRLPQEVTDGTRCGTNGTQKMKQRIYDQTT